MVLATLSRLKVMLMEDATVLGIMSEPSRLIVFYLTTTITTDLIIIHSIYIYFALKWLKIIVEIRVIIYTIQNSDSTKEKA